MIDVKNIEKALKEIAYEYLALFRSIIKEKVGSNTDIAEDAIVEINENNDGFLIDLTINDYILYIEQGRRKHARKVPIDELRDWARKRGIKTDNSTLYAIQQSIYNEGIKGKNIMTDFFDNIDRNIDSQLFDKIFEALNIELEKIINKN